MQTNKTDNKPAIAEMKGRKGKHQIRGRKTDLNAVSEIQQLLRNLPLQRELLIEYLHLIQDKYGYLSSAHICALAEIMKISQAEVYEVASFYHHFDIVSDTQEPPESLTIRVCESISCEMSGSKQLAAQLEKNYQGKVRIQKVPCIGRCQSAPAAVVGSHAVDCATEEEIEKAINANNTVAEAPLNYIDLKAYLQNDGYKLLNDCFQGKQNVDKIIEMLKDSGLRGLGGAGFPAGQKWSILRNQEQSRLVAVNIDEGEPGTFKDRHYLEQDPHRMIEGALIACWAIEAEAVYIYLRDEYAGIRKMLLNELKGLKDILPFELPPIYLRRGAGAYICGEESAMIESIEGKRGMPRLRPPYVAEKGLFSKPTLEHNMETLYWVRDIIEKGPQWFTGEGRHGRTGLRSFSVSGRVNNPGVHLAPAGITIRELIDEYCGGMIDGHKFYGYFPGGASGGMLPATLDQIPLDFDTLQEYGCFIGSAAVIIFSDQDSAKTLALNAMQFFANESCGQCTPCRVGTDKAAKIMKQEAWDVGLLNELANVMVDASICGLGQAAPNPMLCAIKYFPQEFE